MRIQKRIEKRLRVARRWPETKRRLRARENQQNQYRNRMLRKLGRTSQMGEFQAEVNTMTNWERNQWARGGYVGLVPNVIGRLRKELARIRKLRR